MSHDDLARNLDSYGDGYEPSDRLDPLLEAAHALLDELHRVMPVWPEHAQVLADEIGWEAPTDATNLAEILAAPIAPGQALINVARILRDATEDKRTHNGRGRCRAYAGSVDHIAQTGRQLADMVLSVVESPAPTPHSADLSAAAWELGCEAADDAEAIRQAAPDVPPFLAHRAPRPT